MKNNIKLSIIIPCYNEANRGDLSKRLQILLHHTKYITETYEIIFSLDGCTDNTYPIINEFIKSRNFKHWHIIDNPINRGKGYAIREGIRNSSGEYILFMDADLSVELNILQSFINNMNNRTCVIGSRYTRGSQIKNHITLKRKIISLLSRIVTFPLLNQKVSDTQCGFKLFPRNSVLPYIGTMRCDHWLFDVELLMILSKQKINIAEIPVIWNNSNHSTVCNGAIKSSLKELKLLYKNK